MISNTRLIGGTLLVAGTTIGAGMLALPVSTGMAGFFPTALLLITVWGCMTYSAFLVLESNLWIEAEGNMVSMARHTLGPVGAFAAWVIYLFLLYALTTAYIAESIPAFVGVIELGTGMSGLPVWVGLVPLLGIFGFFVYKGTRSVDLVNRVMMAGMVVTYLFLVTVVAPEANIDYLHHTDWCHLPLAATVVVTSFGYAIIVPTLRTYMQGNIPMIRKSMIIGSSTPLIVYLIWEMITLGVVPVEGANGLMDGYEKGISGSNLLVLMSTLLSNQWIPTVARGFSFFAIITSFLGVSLCLMDFLADGIKIKKTSGGRMILYVLTFGPPLVITFTCRRVFLTALEYAGAFGVITLLALFPALMVWSGRYWLKLPSDYQVPGGKGALIFVILFSLAVIGIHLGITIGIIQ